MAVHIKLIKNNIKSSSGYGKYYAKAVSQGEISLKEIAEEACRNSGCSEGTVVMVVTELQDILKHRLSEGQTVILVSTIPRTLTSRVTSPVSSAVSCPPAAASRADISSTISAMVSRPSGRKALNLESLNRSGLNPLAERSVLVTLQRRYINSLKKKASLRCQVARK